MSNPNFNVSVQRNGGALGIPIGDSITLSGDLENVRGNSWPTYAALIANQSFRWIRNAGIGGNNTTQMLARFDSDVIAYNPAFVVINGGRNDISQSVSFDTFKNNIIQMITKVRLASAKPILSTIPPTNQGQPYQDTTSLWNKWIKWYAEQNRIDLLDFTVPLINPATGQYKTGLNADTVHPNAVGYAAMGSYVASRLPAILNISQPPAVPVDGVDPSNKATNGFWTTQTLSTHAPSGWSAANASAVVTSGFSTDAAGITWLTYTFSNSSATFTINPFSGSRPTATATETWIATGLIDAAITAGSYRIAFTVRPTTPVSDYPLFDLSVSAAGRFYMESTATAGLPVGPFQFWVTTGTTGTIKLAQLAFFRKADYAF